LAAKVNLVAEEAAVAVATRFEPELRVTYLPVDLDLRYPEAGGAERGGRGRESHKN
jgi:hypothetical protein